MSNSQVNMELTVTPRYLTELAVGTRTSYMFMCTWSVFRRYVNCTNVDLLVFTGTSQLTHHSSIVCAKCWMWNAANWLVEALQNAAMSSAKCASVMCGESRSINSTMNNEKIYKKKALIAKNLKLLTKKIV